MFGPAGVLKFVVLAGGLCGIYMAPLIAIIVYGPSFSTMI